MTCSPIIMGRFALVQRIFRQDIWCLGVPAERRGEWGEDRILWSPPAWLPASNISINVMNVTQGRSPAAGQHYQLMVISDVSIFSHHHQLSVLHWVKVRWERVGDGQPSPDIIQILSIKTNNQMQSYSPPALSLSYQSSLPEKTSSVFTYISTSRGISSYLLPQLCISSTKL